MIRGTNHDQDARFCDKIKKMLEKSQWPDKYDIKIDLTKVDLELIKVWIQKRLTTLLGEEDDIISGTVIGLIDESIQKQQKLNPKLLHVAISGLLQEKTLTFMSDLCDILDEAQRSSRGIPECLLEDKKKSQEAQRKKLDELNSKKFKLNERRFDRTVQRYDNIDSTDRWKERNHKKHKDRSRSRDKKNKRSRTPKRDKKYKKVKQAKRQRREQRRSRSRSRSNDVRKERRLRSVSSESSSVVSSSSSGK